jgi:hypothetical protein
LSWSKASGIVWASVAVKEAYSRFIAELAAPAGRNDSPSALTVVELADAYRQPSVEALSRPEILVGH